MPKRVLVRVIRPSERGPLSGPGDEVASLAHHRGGDQRGPRGEHPKVPARESSLSPGRRDRSLQKEISPSHQPSALKSPLRHKLKLSDERLDLDLS